MLPYQILDKKRLGQVLSEAEIREVVRGAVDGSWSDAQLGAFLMATAIRGLDEDETHVLTVAMLESGDQWELRREFPTLVDKHSTGGVGDKISLVLAPLLAACDVPVVMLTGRALGHTAGTADKLEAIPGLQQELDRQRCLELLQEHRMAIGVATSNIAPADRRMYGLRDRTATVESIPLIAASILSKKLASGAGALVFDVKTGSGAFMTRRQEARALAQMLVGVTAAMGRSTSALVTDMSQPLGQWVGHLAEVREALECLGSAGSNVVLEVTYALAGELLEHVGSDLTRDDLEAAITAGRAREAFDRWATAQGASAEWLDQPDLGLAPTEYVIEAPCDGILAQVDTRNLGLLMVQAGAGRRQATDAIDHGVALRYRVRLGETVGEGQEMARLYLRREDKDLEARFSACFHIAEGGQAVSPILERVGTP